MRKKFIITVVLTLSVLLNNVFISVVSAAPVGRQSSPLPGAVATTPEEFLFEFEGKKFILLDTEEKNDKKFFFVLCEDVYGRHRYDTAPDRDNASCLSYWEPEDQYNMAYWLNNDFLQDGNVTGESLPAGIIDYLDVEREWSTEEMKDFVGYKEAPNITTHPLALLSSTEWKKYITKIGQNVASGWYFRSARTADNSGATNQVLFTGNAYAVGTNHAMRANGTDLFVRPCFYLSEDFFRNLKITKAGKSVQDAIADVLNKELYTQEELELCMSKPSAENVVISGEMVVGEVISAEYEHIGIYPSDGAECIWYISETENGEFTPIANASEINFELKEEHADKYIKVAVSPKCTSPFVKKGDAVLSELTYGPVFGAAATANILSETRNAGDNILLKVEEYNNIFKVNTLYADIGVSDENKAVFSDILNSLYYDSLSEFRECYYKAAALVRLNAESDKQNINVRLKDEALKLDTTRYEQLSDTTFVDDSVYNKCFSSYPVFEELYFKALAVADINLSDRSNIKDTLLHYDEWIDKDLESVNDYQLGVIATELLKRSYSDFESLNAAVSSAFDVAQTSDQPIHQEKPDSKEENEAMSFSDNGIPSIAYRTENGLRIEKDDNTEVPFFDIDEAAWASESIMYLYDRGIITGYEDGSVKPTKTLLREEFVKMIVDAFLSADVSGQSSFVDVEKGAWYAPYVNKAASIGAITGVGDNKFGVGLSVTRQDMAVILYRLLPETSDLKIKKFNDDNSIAPYAKDAVGKMASIGLINGYEDGTFNPNAEATRAMAAKVIHDMMIYLGER